jgi:hypothetical protein
VLSPRQVLERAVKVVVDPDLHRPGVLTGLRVGIDRRASTFGPLDETSAERGCIRAAQWGRRTSAPQRHATLRPLGGLVVLALSSVIYAPGSDSEDLASILVVVPGVALLVVTVTAGIGAGSGAYIRKKSLRTRPAKPTITALVTALGAGLTIFLASTGIAWANDPADLAPIVFIPAFGLAIASFAGLVLLPWAGWAVARREPRAPGGDGTAPRQGPHSP